MTARLVGWTRRLVVLGLLFGCAKPGPAPQPAASDTPHLGAERPLMLWRVERDGMTPSYLFGTCHGGVGLDESLPHERRSLVTDADVFVSEIDSAELASPALLRRLLFQDGTRMETLLGAEDWARVVAMLGQPEQAAALDAMHPFVTATVLQAHIVNRSEITMTRDGGLMDVALTGLAQRAGVEHQWLETGNEQLDVLLGLEMDLYLQSVRDLLDETKQADMLRQLTAVLDVCRTGEIEPALAVIAESDVDLMKRMLAERNQAWIPKLEGHFERGQVFAAVGAGHLIGDDSVVALLQERGYTVTQQTGRTALKAEPSTGGGGAKRDRWIGVMAEQLPVILCSPNQFIVSCLEIDGPTCNTELTEAVHTCADRLEVPEHIVPTEAEQWGGRVGECAAMHVAERYPVRSEAPPMCAELNP